MGVMIPNKVGRFFVAHGVYTPTPLVIILCLLPSRAQNPQKERNLLPPQSPRDIC